MSGKNQGIFNLCCNIENHRNDVIYMYSSNLLQATNGNSVNFSDICTVTIHVALSLRETFPCTCCEDAEE